MISHPPIPVDDLEEHVARLRANENARFSQEYESIEPGQQFTWEASNRELNKAKNRYANVIAYDHSRVLLQTLDGIPESSYTNANYMDGYRRHNAYIATQVRHCNTLISFSTNSIIQCAIVTTTIARDNYFDSVFFLLFIIYIFA